MLSRLVLMSGPNEDVEEVEMHFIHWSDWTARVKTGGDVQDETNVMTVEDAP
jgi:hypothetical protein